MTTAFYNPPAVASYPAVISGVLMAAPSGSNPAGNYVQLFGNPPPGIALGDVFYWSGSAAILLTTYAQTGGVFQTSAGETWFKIAGTWAKEVTSVSLLASAPVGATPAGLYAMTAGTPPSGVALGDLFYWSGAAATRYIPFASAPGTVDVAGLAYAKALAPTYWKSAGFVPQYGEVVMPLATSISLAGGVTTILTLNIPSAGLWRLEYTCRASIGSNGASGNGAMSRVHDGGGNEVLGTRMTVGFTYGSAIQATGTMSKIVQTTGPAIYTLRAYGWVANLTSIMSDSSGETKMSYQQLA